MRHIIIGGVAAGMTAAMKIRRLDPKAEVTVYQQETEISYAGCGLPYYLGGLSRGGRDKMIVRQADVFRQEHRIEVFLSSQITEIDASAGRVTVHDHLSGRNFGDSYDRLLIATGAIPFIPPGLVTAAANVFSLRSLVDADQIKARLEQARPASAVLIGDGFINMEMAEAMLALGIKTTVISANAEVMPILDEEIAQNVGRHLEEKGIEVVHNFRAGSFAEEQGLAVSVLEDGGKGRQIAGDIFILAIGVRPNTALAQQGGIAIGPTRAIACNARMETNLPGIYTAGDCAETRHLLTGKPVWIPLGSTANKMGRIAGTNMAGETAEFQGIMGTFVAKICDIAVGRTGLSEKDALQEGIDFQKIVFEDVTGPGYYPGGGRVKYKLLFRQDNRKLLGLQAVGALALDKRIDVFSTALHQGMRVDELFDLDLAYAPPFNKPLDSLHVAAMLAAD